MTNQSAPLLILTGEYHIKLIFPGNEITHNRGHTIVYCCEFICKMPNHTKMPHHKYFKKMGCWHVKSIKSFFVLVLIFIGVKACSLIGGGIMKAQGEKEGLSGVIDAREISKVTDLGEGFNIANLENGVSVAIPAGWHIMPDSVKKKNIVNAAKAGLIVDTGKDTALMALTHSNPGHYLASVRVSFAAPELSKADVAATPAADFNALCEQFEEQQFKNGIVVAEMYECSKVKLGGNLGILIKYRREGLNTVEPWIVSMFMVPMDDKLAYLTFSHVIDGNNYDAVIEKMIGSVSFT